MDTNGSAYRSTPSQFNDNASQKPQVTPSAASKAGIRSVINLPPGQPSDPLNRTGDLAMGRTKAEPVFDTRNNTSLVREEAKDVTYILRCKIPWNANVPAPLKRYLRRDDVFSHFTIWGGPTTIVFPLSTSVRLMLELDQTPESDVSATLPRSMARLL